MKIKTKIVNLAAIPLILMVCIMNASSYWTGLSLLEEEQALMEKNLPDYHRDSASFNRRCGIGAVRQPILTSSIIIDSRLNR